MNINEQILQDRIARKALRCENGVDQYLKKKLTLPRRVANPRFMPYI